jgi:hypothetical protein
MEKSNPITDFIRTMKIDLPEPPEIESPATVDVYTVGAAFGRFMRGVLDGFAVPAKQDDDDDDDEDESTADPQPSNSQNRQ